MTLSLRPTGLSSPAFADRADYCVIENGLVIGRIYEDRQTLPELRWFWSITEHVDPAMQITTNGRAPTLEEAKARFRESWSRVVKQVAKKTSSGRRAIQLREWRVTLLRYRREFLGYVKASSRETAESEAAETFNLNDWQRKRLLLQERI